MRIAIRGYKEIDSLQNIINQNELEIVCIIDLNAKLWGEEIQQIPIISPMRALDYMLKNIFEKVIINPLLGIDKIKDIFNEMVGLGFTIDSIRIPKTTDIYKKRYISKNDIVSEKYAFNNFKNLSYLEYHIADKCNLNCASCSHFAPLVKEDYYPDLNNIAKDMERLGKIVDYIEQIRILGGEPFLNKDWKKYLEITRCAWPYSKISIVTNGLLLSELSGEEMDFFIDNDIWIDISLYKPLWNKIDDTVAVLKKRGIRFEVNGGPVLKFTSVFDIESQDDFRKKRYSCKASCNNLHKGKLTPCPVMMYTSFFNEYFEQHLPVGYPINLYDEKLDYKELVDLLKKPMPICRYCNMRSFKQWKTVNREKCEMEDWIVTEKS